MHFNSTIFAISLKMVPNETMPVDVQPFFMHCYLLCWAFVHGEKSFCILWLCDSLCCLSNWELLQLARVICNASLHKFQSDLFMWIDSVSEMKSFDGDWDRWETSFFAYFPCFLWWCSLTTSAFVCILMLFNSNSSDDLVVRWKEPVENVESKRYMSLT